MSRTSDLTAFGRLVTDWCPSKATSPFLWPVMHIVFATLSSADCLLICLIALFYVEGILCQYCEWFTVFISNKRQFYLEIEGIAINALMITCFSVVFFVLFCFVLLAYLGILCHPAVAELAVMPWTHKTSTAPPLNCSDLTARYLLIPLTVSVCEISMGPSAPQFSKWGLPQGR